ncbi:MAG: hypothetical protein AABY32_06290 [Nanoarchaeota archaeon]
MENVEIIYEDLKLETYFDPEKDGYWLVIKNEKPHFFFQKGVLHDFTNLGMNEFVNRINNYDALVLFAAKKYQISAYNIRYAIEETKKIEDNKLEKFLKS